MQHVSFNATRNFAIISAEYVYFDEKERRLALVEELNLSLDEFRKKDELYFEPENVLIIWKNNPDERFLRKKLGHSNDLLIMEFCERVAHASKSEPVELFIDKPQTLFEEGESMFTVLERLINIWKQTKIIPILIKDDFLSLDKKWLLGKEGWLEERDNATSFIDRMKVSYLAKETTLKEKEAYFESVKNYYEHFYASIEKLISILAPEEEKLKKHEDNDEEPRTDFIHTYFLWQAGMYSSVEKAQEAMGQDIPISTWYRYCDKFEDNLVYEEYTVAYWRYLFLGNDKEMQEMNPAFKKDGYLYRPKKGHIPEPIEYICFLNKEERLSLFEPGYILDDPYLKFDKIKALIDVKRAAYTANIQFKHLRCRKTGGNAASDEHYGYKIIKKKLEKAGYEFGDLYPITSPRSPYYEEAQGRVQGFMSFEEMEALFPEREESEEEKEWRLFVEEHKKSQE